MLIIWFHLVFDLWWVTSLWIGQGKINLMFHPCLNVNISETAVLSAGCRSLHWWWNHTFCVITMANFFTGFHSDCNLIKIRPGVNTIKGNKWKIWCLKKIFASIKIGHWIFLRNNHPKPHSGHIFQNNYKIKKPRGRTLQSSWFQKLKGSSISVRAMHLASLETVAKFSIQEHSFKCENCTFPCY